MSKSSRTISAELYEILSKPRRLKFQICTINSQILNLKDCLMPGAVRYDKDNVQTSPADRMPQIMAEIGELSDKQKELSAELLRINDVIKKICDDYLTDELEKTVVLMHHVGMQTFEQIGASISYTKGGVWYIYDKAIDHLEKVKTF